MSRKNLAEFCELIFDDPAQLRRLRETRDRADFTSLMIKLGADAGFDFDRDDIHAVMHENHLQWLQRWM